LAFASSDGGSACACYAISDSIDNLGGFTLINPQSNWIVAGERFNLKAEDVIEFWR
jgi:hypothetical protein